MLSKCQKEYDRKLVNPDGALVYLKLRSKSVGREASIRYAARIPCRYDSTQLRRGPSRNNALNLTVAADHRGRVIEKGWGFGQPDYELGREYKLPKLESDSRSLNFQKLERHLIDQREKRRVVFKEAAKELEKVFQNEFEVPLRRLPAVEQYEEVPSI